MAAQKAVPLAEAARRMGLSAIALRRRAERGTVKAYKEGGRWYVEVPDQAGPVAEPVRTGEAPNNPASDRLTELREDVTFLRERLAARDEEIAAMRRAHAKAEEEWRVLLQTAQRMIPASVPDPIESSVRPAERSTAYEGHRESNASPGAVQRERAAFPPAPRPWWRRLLGLE